MTKEIYNVLFLCTGNPARSIIAEAIMNREGMGKFKAYSAGSKPGAAPHPYTLDLLRGLHHAPMRRRWISCLLFATTPQPKNVHSGRVSR